MREIVVFETLRGNNADLAIALQPAWATVHSDVQVAFSHHKGDLGWHCALVDGGELLLSFPWYDNVDEMLRGDSHQLLPVDLPADGWEDLEQGWWASIIPVGDRVFLAESSLGLVDVPGDMAPSATKPGLAEFGGVPIAWSAVDKVAYEEAWTAAVASCIAGSPAPVMGPVTRGWDT